MLQERLLPVKFIHGRGAEGAIPSREKLSGKRTVTDWDPGKIQTLGLKGSWTPKGINSAECGIISQVKRQEESKRVSDCFPLFYLAIPPHRLA